MYRIARSPVWDPGLFSPVKALALASRRQHFRPIVQPPRDYGCMTAAKNAKNAAAVPPWGTEPCHPAKSSAASTRNRPSIAFCLSRWQSFWADGRFWLPPRLSNRPSTALQGTFACRSGIGRCLHRPARPQGWPVTHCDSAAYVQSSAQKAQRIVRNSLSISRMPATQHATHMLHHPPNGLTTSLTTYQTGRPQAEPDTCHTPHPHPPERKNFCGDAETTAFLRKFAL